MGEEGKSRCTCCKLWLLSLFFAITAVSYQISTDPHSHDIALDIATHIYHKLEGRSQPLNAPKPPILRPVVFVPGLASSVLEARLNRSDAPHPICIKKTDDWFTVWASIAHILVPGPHQHCFAANIVPQYDFVSKNYSDPEGVEIRPVDFGGVEGIRLIDPNIPITKYLAELIAEFEEVGYKGGVNLHGATFDWRFSPLQMPSYFAALKNLIETTRARNSGERVVLIGHSMGGLMALHFLHSMPQVWKDQNVHSFVSLAAPWGGSVKTLKAMLTGDTLGIPLAPRHVFWSLQRMTASTAYLLPSYKLFKNEPIVFFGENRTFSASEFPKLFGEVGVREIESFYPLVRDLTPWDKPPGVDTVCMFGSGAPTPARLKYSTEDVSQEPQIEMGDGDGVVNRGSLEACKIWKELDKDHDFAWQEFSWVNHFTIIKDRAVFDSIKRVVLH